MTDRPKPISEGKVSKGGQNVKPSQDRPPVKPSGQNPNSQAQSSSPQPTLSDKKFLGVVLTWEQLAEAIAKMSDEHRKLPAIHEETDTGGYVGFNGVTLIEEEQGVVEGIPYLRVDNYYITDRFPELKEKQ